MSQSFKNVKRFLLFTDTFGLARLRSAMQHLAYQKGITRGFYDFRHQLYLSFWLPFRLLCIDVLLYSKLDQFDRVLLEKVQTITIIGLSKNLDIEAVLRDFSEAKGSNTGAQCKRNVFKPIFKADNVFLNIMGQNACYLSLSYI